MVLSIIAEIYRFRYAIAMFTQDFFIVFPEGDVQEIPGRLPVNGLVDINGTILPAPLPANRMIVFRVSKIKTRENKGGNETFHYLELLSARDLLECTGA
ncbi:MAG: hypothetical protein LBD18_07530 [Treponema sp.]|jgi:hypothetical protein|nr:hypothetical protein [Treponema sp.]